MKSKAQQHYDLALDDLNMILVHKDDPEFTHDSAQTLCLAAIAEALAGLLRLGIEQQEIWLTGGPEAHGE